MKTIKVSKEKILEEKIIQLIEDIKVNQLNLLKTVELIDLLNKEYDLKLIDHKDSILNATDENNKKIYTNEAQREVALKQILNEDEKLIKLSNDIKKHIHDKQVIEIDIKYLNNYLNFYKIKYQNKIE